MSTLLDHLIDNAQNAPDKPFLILWESGKYRIISNSDFLDLSRSVGHFIKGEIETSDDVVFIILQHHPLLHAMFIGCMLASAIPSYLPFPTPKQDAERYFKSHEQLFNRVKPSAIITYRALAGPLRDIVPESTKILIVEDYAHSGYLGIAEAGRSGQDVALLQHSSGTTGLKKGVALTFQEIEQQAREYAEVADLDAHSVIASWLPLYHDMGLLTSFLIPLSVGAAIVSINAFEWVKEPGLLLKTIEIFNGTHTWLPNFAFNHIVKAVPTEQRFKLDSMKAFISCSEPSKPATIEAFAERFSADGAPLEKLQACYAMAESVFAVSQYPVGVKNRLLTVSSPALGEGKIQILSPASDGAIELVSNGPPLPGIEVAIMPSGGELIQGTDIDRVGEILIKGPFVFKNYYRNEEASLIAFEGGWYRTGDLGFVQNGELFICGRTKDLIIVHGRNYYCHDIEEIASSISGVIPGRAVAIGIYDAGTASEELLLLVETRLEGTETAEHKSLRRELKRAIFERLELTPRDVEFVPPMWLVKTTSGKLSRTENLERLRSERRSA